MNKIKVQNDVDNAFAEFKTAINQWENINLKRMDGGWSVGEIAAHVVKATVADFGRSEPTQRAYDEHAQSIRDLFLNFQLKFPSAPELQPALKDYSKDELIRSLDQHQETIDKLIGEEDLSQICPDIELPGWGALTKYEWMVLIETHILRHAHQVNCFQPATL